MSSALKNIQISEAMLQAIMHEYIEKMRRHKSTCNAAESIQDRWTTEMSFYTAACNALSQAIVFSTLATMVSNQEDFELETRTLASIDDPVISALRRDVFKAGIRCAVESIGTEMAKELNVSQRVQIFEKLTTAAWLD